ncbi:MAG TPA: peptide chain release factor N(5)-glutamine methyltransferase [Bacillota bacterium]|nr:peptide chain release factor N(5)-glutamine methyltransferase [Bacillota bacterium]
MKKTYKQYEVLEWASLFLEKNEREPNVAKILLEHVLNVDQSTFYMNMQMPISDEQVKSYENLIHIHVETGEPVQHLLGYAHFFGRKFSVNEHVLIPRQETEELVDLTLKKIDENFSRNESLVVVDVGTGSGVIGTTLALEHEQLDVYATDISERALEVAKANATQLGAHVQFLQGNFLQPIINNQTYPQIIVSNPPYIAYREKDHLSDTVKNYDPDLALFAENDGLAAYETILKQIANHFTSVSLIMFEIGYTQGVRVTKLIKSFFPNSTVEIIKDINGQDRIVSAYLEHEFSSDD